MRYLWFIALVACGRHAQVEDARRGDQIVITVTEPGASVEDLEASVAIPIEQAVRTGSHVAHVRTSIEPASVKIDVELAHGADGMAASMEVRDQLSAILRRLPPDVAPPVVVLDREREQVARYTVRSEVFNRVTLSNLAASMVQRPLLGTPDVSGVMTCGNASERTVLELDPLALGAAGLALDDVTTSLGGLDGALADRYRDAIVAQRNGAPIRFGDIAKVYSEAQPECRALDEHGEVIAGTVFTTTQVVDRVRTSSEKVLAGAAATLGPGTSLTVWPGTRPIVFAIEGDTQERAMAARDLLAHLGHVAHMLVEAGHGQARVSIVPADGADADALEAEAVATLRHAGFGVHDRREVVAQLFGPDGAKLAELAGKASTLLAATTGVVANGVVGDRTRVSSAVAIDRAVAADLGVSGRAVLDAVLATSDDGLERGGSVLRAHGDGFTVRGASGTRVPMTGFTRTEQRSEVVERHREDGSRWLGVAAAGDPDVIRAALGKLELPAGYRWVFVPWQP